MINVIKNEINVGVNKPFTIIHMTDTHVTGVYSIRIIDIKKGSVNKNEE